MSRRTVATYRFHAGDSGNGWRRPLLAKRIPLVKRPARFFRWVSANVPWEWGDEYCIDSVVVAIKGFTARRGDCGVQNTVFITMLVRRYSSALAEWFEIKPGQWGCTTGRDLHSAVGWLPADAFHWRSEIPRSAHRRFLLWSSDSYRLIVNSDWGRELFPPKESLRSEPADFQRGEVEVDG